MSLRSLACLGFAISIPAIAAAQAPTGVDEASAASEDEGEEIVVTGQRLRGSVVGDIAPELTLTPGDVRSYGVSSLADLIAELAPQTSSGRGRGGESPVVLLNGRRISSFAEIRNIPTEAIQRVEILPEEVALKYGYRADQKVVNVVLRRRFNAVTAELEGAVPTGVAAPIARSRRACSRSAETGGSTSRSIMNAPPRSPNANAASSRNRPASPMA